MGHEKYTFSLTRRVISTLVAVSLIILGQGCATSPLNQEIGADDIEVEKWIHQLRDNVVSITVEWQDRDGNTKKAPGYGFIVGERDGYAYIVTAYHVVHPRSLKSQPDTSIIIKVKYFSRRGDTTYPANLLDEGNEQLDLAVLKAEFPKGLPWHRQVLSPESPDRGTRVWFIGRSGKWYIPSAPGSVNKIDLEEDRIHVDKLDVMPGTSGAPLINDSGIVGMIVTDSPDKTSKALQIGRVKTANSEWGIPWHLTVLPVRNEQPPSYKKWWVWALGGVVVAALAAVLIPGGDGGGEENPTLTVGAPFPEP